MKRSPSGSGARTLASCRLSSAEGYEAREEWFLVLCVLRGLLFTLFLTEAREGREDECVFLFSLHEALILVEFVSRICDTFTVHARHHLLPRGSPVKRHLSNPVPCCAFVIAVALLGNAIVHGAEAAKPNIVVFLVDDMGIMDTSVPFLADIRHAVGIRRLG